MFVYPINVDGCKPPSYFRSVQFDAVGEGDFDLELIVDRIVTQYDLWRVSGSKP